MVFSPSAPSTRLRAGFSFTYNTSNFQKKEKQ